MLVDNRRIQRRQVRIAAKMQIDGGPPTRDCTVVDISDYGARIEMDAAADTPDRFPITMTARGYPYRRCRVVWRSDSELGVEFDHPLTVDRDRPETEC
jgi:hypothetical protein